jgi:hypothetical protein
MGVILVVGHGHGDHPLEVPAVARKEARLITEQLETLTALARRLKRATNAVGERDPEHTLSPGSPWFSSAMCTGSKVPSSAQRQ